MRLSVVVVTHNSAECIQACLAAARGVLGRSELIVMDNLSEDATLERAIAAAPDARIVEMGSNAGYGRACNAGVHAATCDHVVLMNPDVVLTHLDRELLERLIAEEPFGLIAPGLAFSHDAYAAARPQMFARSTWLKELVKIAFGPLRPKELPQRARLASDDDALWACGALMIVRKREFLELGGFDERFFLYYEDQELGIRYRGAQLPLRGTAAILGTHAAGTSSETSRDRIEPLAWRLLGWLELVASDHGLRRAALSWRGGGGIHRTARRSIGWMAAGASSERLSQKVAELAALEHAVERLAVSDDADQHTFCPRGRRAIAYSDRI